MQNNESQEPFPGTVDFVEIFDTEDDFESGNVLSFETLRQAFATIHSAESELAQTILDIEVATEEITPQELPNYEIEDVHELDDNTSPNGNPTNDNDIHTNLFVRLDTIVEAILFVGNRENQPFSAEKIAENLRNVSPEEVEQTVASLNNQYEKRNCPYVIVFERDGYQMVLRNEFEHVRSNFYGKTREIRLSQQAIDILAIVAYKQPISLEDIQTFRKQSSSAALNQLVRRNLLTTTQEQGDKKMITLYHTTPRFLKLLNIESLEDIHAMLREQLSGME